MKTIKYRTYQDVPDNYTGIIEYPDGTKKWFSSRRLHREDGPAIEYPDGIKYWHLNGKQYTKEEHFQYVAKNHPESIRKLIWNL